MLQYLKPLQTMKVLFPSDCWSKCFHQLYLVTRLWLFLLNSNFSTVFHVFINSRLAIARICSLWDCLQVQLESSILRRNCKLTTVYVEHKQHTSSVLQNSNKSNHLECVEHYMFTCHLLFFFEVCNHSAPLHLWSSVEGVGGEVQVPFPWLLLRAARLWSALLLGLCSLPGWR